MGETFDGVASSYRDASKVQKTAGFKLFEKIAIAGHESILDVACGPGHLTKWMSDQTTGRVVGTDISEAMIEEARKEYPGLEFRRVAAEELDYVEQFDVVYCNSALQWFKDGPLATGAMTKALGKGGKLGVGCPATREFAPWFIHLVKVAAERPDIGDTFSHWRNPWFQLPRLEDYVSMFEGAGLQTVSASIDREVAEYSVDDAFGVYVAGAARGFAGKDFYDVPVGDDFVVRFNDAIREEMEKDSTDGKVTVDFNRLYYIGRKPTPDGITGA
jgi:trans-aconitate methyltransferase